MEIVLFFMGKVNSGKTTQAEYFAGLLDLEHIETSKLLEKSFEVLESDPDATITFQGKAYSVAEDKRIYDSGELNTSEYVFGLVEQAVRRAKADGRGVVFSGSPRKIVEAKVLVPFLEELYGESNLFAFVLEIVDEVVPVRAAERKREIDQDGKLATRLAWFRRDALPTIRYLERMGVATCAINGERDVDSVSEEIQEHLSELLGN